MIKVYLAGEGTFELGGRAGHPAYQDERPGVVEALLRLRVPSGWKVAGARVWKDVPKFKAWPGESPERQNVRGAALDAAEAGCDVLVFVRDRDRSVERERAITETVDALISDGTPVIGAVALECTDAWILAIDGQKRSETLGTATAKAARERLASNTAAAVDFLERRGLAAIAPDAKSLLAWLERADVVLGTR